MALGVLSTSAAPSQPVLRRLLRYLRPFRRTLAIALGLLLLATLTDVAQPFVIKTFINRDLIPRHFAFADLWLLGVGYLGLIIASAGLNVGQLFLFQQVALAIVRQLREDVFQHVLDLSMSVLDRTPVGVLVSRITNDTEAILQMFMTVLSTVVQNVTVLLGILAAMLWLDRRLGLEFILVLPIVGAIIAVYRRVSGPVFHQAREYLARLNALLNESLAGMALIQAMGQEGRMRDSFHAINEAYRRARLKNTRINALLLRPLMEVIYTLAIIWLLASFGVRGPGAINIGILYAFLTYLGRVFEPINGLMQRLNFFQQAMVSAERVFELMDEPDTRPQAIDGDGQITAGHIELEHIWFRYGEGPFILKDISMNIPPGATAAIVGPTGSGKSSLMNLLMRFYLPTEGVIRIDGQPLERFSDRELRSKMTWVLQDPFIFVGDILFNIRLGDDIGEAEAVQAARLVQADSFIRALPEGYHTPLGERGATLSAGQRQLLSFARAMARQPVILILDEATAHVDSETESAIQQALRTMRKGRTTVMIAHRLSTVVDADIIYVLHQGAIVEQGTHESLMARQGRYYAMFQSQDSGLPD